MNQLFSIESCTPEIGLFGFYHIVVFSLSFIIFHYIIHKQKITRFSECLAKLSTIIILLLVFITYGWYIAGPESLFFKGLPLYTCRIVPYLFYLGIFHKKEKCLRLAAYWGCYGGIAGLVFPTIFKYPFPHVLQISTVLLHVYLFLLSSYYLFVKRIGMSTKDSNWCCKITLALLTFNTVFNHIFDTNYTSTRRMPAHLINYLGLDIPDLYCLPAVAIGYFIVTYFQQWVVGKCTIYYENKSVKESSLLEED